MQYHIHINQKVFLEEFPDLDIIDAAIFDFMQRFMASDKIDRLIIGEDVYYWVSYAKIIDELPIIGITSKDRVYRRIRRLMQAGLLEPFEDNQRTARTYFKAGPRFDSVSFSETKVRRKQRTPSVANNGRS